MNFTHEQFEKLSQWETHFDTAINARYARFPGTVALKTMQSIITLAKGTTKNVNMSCGTCILHFLQDVGKLYFADKAERTRVAVKASEETAIRTEVKTKRGRKPKTQE